MISPTAQRQLEQHDYSCLDSDRLLLIPEAVHFLYYHRWWDIKDIQEHIDLTDCPLTLLEMIHYPYTCKHSVPRGKTLLDWGRYKYNYLKKKLD